VVPPHACFAVYVPLLSQDIGTLPSQMVVFG
jgi:hypothetical protein